MSGIRSWQPVRTALAGVTVAAFMAVSPAALAEVHQFQFTLSGSQEVPPNASPGTGSGTVVLDDATGVVTLAGSRLYTSMADTDAVVDDALARFARVFDAVEPAR